MGNSARFWDRMAHRYAKMPIRDEAAYQRKLQVTREYFRPDMEVLEIGCATGSTALAHAPFVRRIRAIDVSSKMLEIARGKAATAKIDNVRFEQATVESLNVPPRSLDAVLALNVLHLVDDKEDFIARVHAMLKPGGIFVTSTPCLADSSLKYLKPIAPIAAFVGLIPMLRVFSAVELIESVRSAGFEIDHEWQPGKNKGVFLVAKSRVAQA